MAEWDFGGRTACGLLVAILVAPFTVAFAAGLLARPSDPLLGVGLAAFAMVVAAPLSGLVILFVGVPAIMLAHRLRTRSAWYYTGCGLVGGPASVLVGPGKSTGPADIAVCAAGGLAASLVYWLIAERGRPKDSATDI